MDLVQWNIVKLNTEGLPDVYERVIELSLQEMILPGQTPQGFMIATKKETTSTIGIVPETLFPGTLGCQFQSQRLANEKTKTRQSLYEAVFFSLNYPFSWLHRK